MNAMKMKTNEKPENEITNPKNETKNVTATPKQYNTPKRKLKECHNNDSDENDYDMETKDKTKKIRTEAANNSLIPRSLIQTKEHKKTFKTDFMIGSRADEAQENTSEDNNEKSDKEPTKLVRKEKMTSFRL